jgi:hypothetical protein
MQDGAAALGAGVNLAASAYDLNVGTPDYCGRLVPHAVGTRYNMGADGSAAPRR